MLCKKRDRKTLRPWQGSGNEHKTRDRTTGCARPSSSVQYSVVVCQFCALSRHSCPRAPRRVQPTRTVREGMGVNETDRLNGFAETHDRTTQDDRADQEFDQVLSHATITTDFTAFQKLMARHEDECVPFVCMCVRVECCGRAATTPTACIALQPADHQKSLRVGSFTSPS